MTTRLKQLEQKYIECIIEAMDKPSGFNMLDSGISTIDFNQTYFMLEASPIKGKEKERYSEQSVRLMPQGEGASQAKDLLDVLQNNSRTIIYGEAGAGKTTSLFYLTILLIVNYAKQTGITIEKAELEPGNEILKKNPFNDLYVPVFINLSEIKEQHLASINRFNDLIVQQVEQIIPNEAAGDLVTLWQKEERLWLILDGLDEMTISARKDFLAMLRDFLKLRNENKVTLTSRPTGMPFETITYKERDITTLKLLHPYNLCPLADHSASTDFAKSWLKKLGVANYEEKTDALIEGMMKRGIIKLMRNPMLLRMMIDVYATNDWNIDPFPSSRIQLYDMYIHDVVLRKGDLQKFQIKNENNDKHFNQLMKILEHIAWLIHREDRALGKEDLMDIGAGYCKDSAGDEDWFDIFSNQMRILFINASGEYEFFHRSYQEYFVARRLVSLYKESERGQKWVMEKIINNCAYSSHYRAVILMYLKEISLDIQEDKRYATMKKLFGELPAYQIIKIEDLFAERILDPKQGLVFEENTQDILAAINVLGSEDNYSQVKILINAFIDEKITISKKALAALGGDVESDAVFALITAFQEAVRDNEVQASGKIGNSPTVDALIMDLQDEIAVVCVGAARALGEIADSRAVEALMIALQDEDEFVRRMAAEALGKLGDSHSAKPQINPLDDKDEVIHGSIAEALGEKGDSRAVEALINALQDGDIAVRNLALAALGKINNEQANHALIDALGDIDVKYASQKALVNNGSPRVVDSLSEALQDENAWIRSSAATLLGRIGDSRAVDALINALQDEKTIVRGNAAGALGEIGDSRAVDALIFALQDEDDFVYRMVTKALGEIGGRSAMDALIIELKDTSLYKYGLYKYTKRTLGFIKSVGVAGAGALIHLLDHVSNGKIKNIHDAASKADKKNGLNEEYDAYIQRNFFYLYVIRALGKIGNSDAVDILISILKADGIELFVRTEAVNSLMYIGDLRAVEVLLNVLSDKSWHVCKKTAENLEKLGVEPEIVKGLQKEPKSRKLLKEALNIFAMKTTLPILPDPEIPN